MAREATTGSLDSRDFREGSDIGSTDAADIGPLAKLSEEARRAKFMLTQPLMTVEMQFKGEYQWEYDLVLEDPNGARISRICTNGPYVLYPTPVLDGPWPFNFNGNSQWKVISFTQRVQPHAKLAQEYWAQAMGKAEGIGEMTIDDLDALITLPIMLHEANRVLQNSITYLDSTAQSLGALSQDVDSVGTWRDDASKAYMRAIGRQAEALRECEGKAKDVVKVIDALTENVTNIMNALAELYKDRIQQWGDAMNEVIGLASNPKSWSSWAEKFLNMVTEHYERNATEFQQTLDALQAQLASSQLAEDISRIGLKDWPSPTGESLSRPA